MKKLQKDHDLELDEIEEFLKVINESVGNLANASGKKALVREINEKISDTKNNINKARGKQINLADLVDDSELKLGNHPEMVKCKEKHNEQVNRLKDCIGLLDASKKSVGKVNTSNEIELSCGHAFPKDEFAD